MVSKTVELDGPTHYLDFGGDGPPLVCVHGLGGSAINWMAVGTGLAELGFRVLAPDLRGFGDTPLGPGSATVESNQAMLDRFLEAVTGTPAVLVGNSMGALISVLQAARRPESVRALVLACPALPSRGQHWAVLIATRLVGLLLLPVADPLIEFRIKRLGAERLVAETLAAVCADPSRVAPEVVRAHVELTERRLGLAASRKALLQAAVSTARVMTLRAYRTLPTQVRAPVLLLQGDKDRVIPPNASLFAARRLGWEVQELAGVGHVPMLEVPDTFLTETGAWLRSHLAEAV